MVSQPGNHTQNRSQRGKMPRLVQQVLLVPEAPLLLALLALHLLMGESPLVALAGLTLVAIFLLRSGLLFAASYAMQQAQYERAGRLLGVALRLHPWSSDGLALRGALALTQGRAEAAERDIRQAMRRSEGRAALHAALGSALLEQGRLVEARWECLRALELDPRCAAATLHLAQAEQRLGAPATEVEARLRQGLGAGEDAAGGAALRCALALLLLEQGRASEARLMVAGVETLAVRCRPADRAVILYHLAEVERGAGNQDDARDHFRASEQLDPHGRNAAAAWRAARL